MFHLSQHIHVPPVFDCSINTGVRSQVMMLSLESLSGPSTIRLCYHLYSPYLRVLSFVLRCKVFHATNTVIRLGMRNLRIKREIAHYLSQQCAICASIFIFYNGYNRKSRIRFANLHIK